MKKNASTMERFEGWFVKPIEVLKNSKDLPEGDGGFFALSMALSLFERYYRVKSKTESKHRRSDFKIKAASDLKLSPDEFKAFWKVYRNGTQHQCMPIDYTDEKGITYKWRTHDDFNATPKLHPIDASTVEIQLNPWEFADFIIDKYKSDPNLDQYFKHAFAAVL